MVALWNRTDHYIFILSFVVLLSFFPRLISAVVDWMSATWCGLSANLECRSEMYCTRLAGNAGRKNRHLRTIVQLCRHISSQLRQVSAEIGPVVWDTPANFNGFRVLGALLHGSQVVGVSQTLRR